MKYISCLIIMIQVLTIGMSMSVHGSATHHEKLHGAHIHIQQQTDSDIFSPLSDTETSDHENLAHVHLPLVLLTNAMTINMAAAQSIRLDAKEKSLTSRSYAPPVPPPNSIKPHYFFTDTPIHTR